jgi:hypothetical protein
LRGLEVLVPIGRLVAGQTFHRTVQRAFLAGLVDALGFPERQWRLITGGRGRVDLAVEVDGGEQMLVIIEIKGTDWDKIPAARLIPADSGEAGAEVPGWAAISGTWRPAGGHMDPGTGFNPAAADRCVRSRLSMPT